MASSAKVLNLSDNRFYKRSQAYRWINEQCAYGWVEEGKTFRRLTLQQTIAARQKHQALSEPLEHVNPPGIIERRPATDSQSLRARRELIRSAQWFVEACS